MPLSLALVVAVGLTYCLSRDVALMAAGDCSRVEMLVELERHDQSIFQAVARNRSFRQYP
jgi:hypothetical protein